MSKIQYVLVTVTGPDHPGITAGLMSVVAKDGHRVIDMGQSVTHGLLSLSILLDTEVQDSPVLKNLLFEAKKMGLDLDFKVIENGDKEEEASEVFILSCVAKENITPHFLADAAKTLASHKINIQRIDNITKKFNSVEITTSTPNSIDWQQVKQDLITVSNQHKIDVAFLKDNIFRRNKRLIVFDMDSTLIQTEVIDELADAHGVGDEIKKITHQAMEGQLDFDQSLVTRVGKLKGFPVKKMQNILENLPLTPGVEEFIKTVKGLGYKVAVISGGFTYFANALKEKLGLDYAFANELEVRGEELTGKVTGAIINPQQKAIILEMLAQQESISLEQVVAIGDGANDLLMLSKAGLGIAFHAKEVVKQNAEQHMSHGPMTSILYFLGIPGPQ